MINMETIKQKAIRLINEKGCTYEFDGGVGISVFPPNGYTIDGLELGFVCHSWKDVIDRLSDRNISILPINMKKKVKINPLLSDVNAGSLSIDWDPESVKGLLGRAIDMNYYDVGTPETVLIDLDIIREKGYYYSRLKKADIEFLVKLIEKNKR